MLFSSDIDAHSNSLEPIPRSRKDGNDEVLPAQKVQYDSCRFIEERSACLTYKPERSALGHSNKKSISSPSANGLMPLEVSKSTKGQTEDIASDSDSLATLGEPSASRYLPMVDSQSKYSADCLRTGPLVPPIASIGAPELLGASLQTNP